MCWKTCDSEHGCSKEDDKMQIQMDSVLNEDVSVRMRKVEEFSRIKFPASYSRFIAEYNVGIPITNQFKCGEHLRN